MQTSVEWKKLIRRFLKRHLTVVGFILIAGVVLFAIFGPILVTYDPTDMDIRNALSSPGSDHLLGTDQFGRDTLSRLAYGARISIQVGGLATLASLLFGVISGSLAGYAGRIADTCIMRFMDALMAFPGILLAIALVGVLGPGLMSLIFAISIGSTPRFARLTRAVILQKKNLEYVLASRALGKSGGKILFSDILPNCMSPLIVQITLTLPSTILSEAALGFLGLGAPPPAPSWGRMLNEARAYMEISPEQAIFPGLVIFITVLGFNLLGDGLRDVLDPKMVK